MQKLVECLAKIHVCVYSSSLINLSSQIPGPGPGLGLGPDPATAPVSAGSDVPGREAAAASDG